MSTFKAKLAAASRWWREDTWVRPFLAQYRRALLASLALGVLALVFAVGLMFTAGYLISDAAEQPALGLFSLLVPLGLVQVFGIVKPFLSWRERLKSHDWVLRVTSDLRTRLFGTVAGKSTFWQATQKTGELLGLLADDIDHVQNLYLRCVFPLACAWIAWVLAAVFLGLFSAPFALFAALGLGVLCVLMPLAAALVNGARAERAKRESRTLYARLYDDIVGLADWGFAQRKSDYVGHVQKEAARYEAETAARRASLRRFDLVANLVFGALSVAVAVWAAWQFGAEAQAPAAAGQAGRPADWIAAFVIGFFPLLEAFAPASDAAAGVHEHRESVERLNALDAENAESPEKSGQSARNAGQASGASGKGPGTAANNAESAFGAHSEKPGSAAPASAEPAIAAPQPPYALRVEHVSFAYPGAACETLRDISLTVEPGQHVALLGPSGCGKSTLLALMRGYLAPTAGSIMLGGANVRSLGDTAPRFVSIVQQGTYLFNRSIYENLALGDPAIARVDAEAALEAVGLSDLLAKLPQGIDAPVSEAGLNFSGGEAHRIALARVLLRRAPVVLLDEPTVSLDPPTERALLETMFSALTDRTVVMATHHLAGVERMDRVIFLDEGGIALDGSPQELARTSARYRRLLTFDRGETA